MRVLDSDWEATASGREGFPAEGLPEIAFLGRSNVGKSSLLNRLLRRKNLARTSSTPGKTRLLHFFRVRGEKRSLLFVDLPGYGYAQVSLGERKKWKELIEEYLRERGALACAVVLHDARRDIGLDERNLLDWLAERGVPSVLAITKIDKLKPNQRRKRVRDLHATLEEEVTKVVATSAVKGDGIDGLWKLLDGYVDLHEEE